ncbi:TIGR03619 family F420-dependent LLM class oxidoreductase [Nakamurella lactea]|uniref:TIGR03619 family F420-dependent LLM class oxidoreductase n=1 Tax=Nakamurella lactea TaxID=459515 RepID=UPI0004919D19|nr:TIGR03619 family F420-dependent LLM class oxidoreductase [Nakamurella lactea]
MRIGVLSPVVFRPTGQFSPWEVGAGTAEIVTIAQAADRLGYHHLTCSEHTAVPTAIAAKGGGTYWDPLATLGFLAAKTERIALATHVLVLGYHHPLDIAKSYGTLDRLSGGRVILGLGVGSGAAEFALLGKDFANRGAIADDAIAALRASWGRETPSYRGPHFEFDDFVVDPHAPRTEVPLWIGGYTPRSLRRARELATGWAPFGLSPDRVAELLARGVSPDGFDVILPLPPLDPTREAERTIDLAGRHREAGATVLNVALRADNVEHWVEQATALKELLPDAAWSS